MEQHNGYDPSKVYRGNEHIPSHGAHTRHKRKKRNGVADKLNMLRRGTVAGVGSKGAASKKRSQK